MIIKSNQQEHEVDPHSSLPPSPPQSLFWREAAPMARAGEKGEAHEAAI